jgi:hypothetical protein
VLYQSRSNIRKEILKTCDPRETRRQCSNIQAHSGAIVGACADDEPWSCPLVCAAREAASMGHGSFKSPRPATARPAADRLRRSPGRSYPFQRLLVSSLILSINFQPHTSSLHHHGSYLPYHSVQSARRIPRPSSSSPPRSRGAVHHSLHPTDKRAPQGDGSSWCSRPPRGAHLSYLANPALRWAHRTPINAHAQKSTTAP